MVQGEWLAENEDQARSGGGICLDCSQHGNNQDEETPAANDDLTVITGIGPTTAERLAEVGITTFAALAAAERDEVAAAAKAAPSVVTYWQQDAAGLAG